VIYLVILDYGIIKKKKPKNLILHHRNMHHINDISHRTKRPLIKRNLRVCHVQYQQIILCYLLHYTLVY